MRRSVFLVLSLAVSSPGFAGPQATAGRKPVDAAAILDRYVQVTGGADAYRRYNFVAMYSTVTPDGGEPFYVTEFRSRDGKTQTEIDAGAASRTKGISNGVVWTFSKDKGATIVTGKPAERALANARGLGEDDWRDRFPTVKMAGSQLVNGKQCYHLKLTRLDGSLIERFYDVRTGLLVRELSTDFDESGKEQPVATDFQEYERSLGIVHPSLMHVKIGGHATTIQVNSVNYFPGPLREAFEIPPEVIRAAAGHGGSASLPNPVDLVEKFIEVTGGKAAYQSIKTEVIKGDITLKQQNLKFPLVVYAAQHKVYAYFDVPSMGKFEFGSNGQIGWERSVVLGPRLDASSPMTGMLGPNTDEILRWTQSDLGLRTTSKDTVNGAPCYQVSMGAPGQPDASTACFDVQTGYLVKLAAVVKSANATVPTEMIFSDYRSHEGFKTAHHVETRVAGQPAVVELNEITVNGALPDGIFDLPADVHALVQKKEMELKGKSEEPVERPTLRRSR